MNQVAVLTPSKALIIYPSSDGKPMADSTIQARWIVLLYTGLMGLFRNVADVFVAADLFWYPAEEFDKIKTAPDVMVVFGRPKGDRKSYLQWEEKDIAPQVAFEILSESNAYREMKIKLDFYEDHGVQEYYLYDPETNKLEVYLREGSIFRRLRPTREFVSPLLKIRFDLSGPEMVIFGPDGRRFLTPEEIQETRLRVDRLAELTLKLLSGQASDEEKQELTRLAQPAP